ncbi:ABC transporter substrate-binding protein [Microbacterium sp.]|uniref:ABC transporter substrate-binding protein n=1 Tax=Microbacterium sp. TaxID=51671 RepID=UPI003A86C763
MRNRHRTLTASAFTVAVGVLVLSGCAASSDRDGSEGGGQAVTFAQITTVSGGFPFGDTVKGTQSYINLLNDNGGLNGYRVEFVSGDDKGDAAEAAQLARKFIQQDGVVGMVGNTSIVDCQANRAIYEANDIAVMGGGAQTDCYQQPNWMPITGGPFVGAWIMWTYAVEQLQAEAVCIIGQNDPTSVPYFEQLREAFEAQYRMQFALATYTNDTTQDPTPAMTNAKSAGCDVIVTSTVAPNFAAMVASAESVGLDATFIDGGSAYDTTLPGTLGSTGEPGALGPDSAGVFVGSQMTPLDDPSAEVREMVDQLDKDGVDANFWSQIGWVSAKLYFDALARRPDADLTSPSEVLTALREMDPVESDFTGVPIVFGDGDTHSPNLSYKLLTITDGQFVNAPGLDDGWIVIDPLPEPEG